MTKARSEQVSLEDTSYYHCYVRCVRRAYLCGSDRVTGENFDHRKQWITSRLRFLSYVYAIDVCAYAVMSNHYHTVLHVDVERANGWSDAEVVERWTQLYSGNVLVNRWLQEANTMDQAQIDKVYEVIAVWRERLCNISWFMRGVNETIARMANEEENCKGRFWEGRFKSQALLDDAAVLSCMAYVDLNPVRAAMEPDVTSSDFTSIQQRLNDYAKTKSRCSNDEKTIIKRVKKQQKLKQDLGLKDQPEAPLMPFDGSAHTSVHAALPFTLEEYFDLIDVTGRVVRDDKRGSIAGELPPLVSRLGIDPKEWLNHVKNFSKSYGNCAGSVSSIADYAHKKGKCWGKGMSASKRVYAVT